MSDTASLSVIIVNYNTASLVLAHIEAIRQEIRSFTNAHIFVVDNASPDGDLQILQGALDGVTDATVIDAGRNLGFAGGNNLAYSRVKAQGTDYVLVLNPDAKPLPNSIVRLASFLDENQKAAIAGAQIVDPSGTLSPSYFQFPTIARELAGVSDTGFIKRLVGAAHDYSKKADTAIRVDWVSGSAFVLRQSALDQFMDDGFFLYYEETDMMRGLHREGWEIWHCPDAEVMHIGGVATGVQPAREARRRMPEYWFDSWRRYFVKNHGRPYALAAAIAKMSGLIIAYVGGFLRGVPVRYPEKYLSDIFRQCFLATLMGR